MTGTSPIKIYTLCTANPKQFISPFCWAAQLAIVHKGLSFEPIPWRLADKEVIAFSGSKTVPVIVDGEKVVPDSWKIAEYLEETYPDRPSLFGGPQGKAAIYFVRSWVISLAGEFNRQVIADERNSFDEPARSYCTKTMEQMFGCTLEEYQATRDEKLPDLRASFQPLRITLQNQEFIGGDSPNFGDYAVFGFFQWMSNYREILEKDDPIWKWRETVRDLFDGLARKHLPA